MAEARFQRLTIEQGLPNGELFGMVQDGEGFMWLGTADGFCRYDGYSVMPLSSLTGSPQTAERLNHRPLFVCRDAKKRWWTGSDWDGVSVYDPMLDSIRSIKKGADGLCGNDITCLLSDAQGRVWIGTFAGLSVYDTQTEGFLKPTAQALHLFDACKINDFEQDGLGRVWVATSERGLWCFEPGQSFPVQVWPKASNQKNDKTLATIKALDVDGEGNLWFATENGLWFLGVQKGAQVKQVFRMEMEARVANFNILDIKNDQNGRIWIGTFQFGAFVIDKNSGQIASFKQEAGNPFSLLSNQIMRIALDGSGNIWFSCRGEGVCILPASYGRFRQFRPSPDPQTNANVHSMATSANGTVYAALPDALMILQTPYRKAAYSTLESLGIGGPLYRVAASKRGDCWLATGSGIWQLASATARRATKVWDGAFNFMSFQVLGDTALWFGGYSEGIENSNQVSVFHLKKRTLRTESIKGPHPRNEAMSLAPAMNNAGIWVGTYQGLMWVQAGQPTKMIGFFPGYNGKGGHAVETVWDDGQQVWWGRADGGGLNVFRRRDGAYNFFLKAHGLPESSVTAILPDSRNRLWVGTYWGLSCFPKPADISLKTILQTSNYNEADGTGGNTIHCGVAASGGDHLFFGTNGGLIVVRTADFGDLPETKLVFTQLRLFGRLVRPGDSTGVLQNDLQHTQRIVLNYKQNFFTLAFSALNFYEPLQNTYHYRLRGLSDDWVNNENSNEVSFAGLRPGRYALEVRAKGKNGLWSTVRTVEITVTPPFWQHHFFITGLFLFFGALGFAFYRWRVGQLMQVERVRQGIAADLHDDIGSALNNIEILGLLGQKTVQQTEKSHSAFEKIIEEARRSKEALQVIVWSLNDENDQVEQLSTKMRRMAAEILEPLGIRVGFDLPDGENFRLNMPPDQRRDLLLAYREALTNICKHAGANEVEIALLLKEKRLLVEIRDNGTGLPANNNTQHGNGLRNMRQRLQKWNGHFRAENRTGGGLSLTMEWALPK